MSGYVWNAEDSLLLAPSKLGPIVRFGVRILGFEVPDKLSSLMICLVLYAWLALVERFDGCTTYY